MFHSSVAAPHRLQHRQVAVHVRPHVCEGSLQGVSYARLRAQMHDARRLGVFGREREHGVAIGEIGANEAEGFLTLQFGEARFLEYDRVYSHFVGLFVAQAWRRAHRGAAWGTMKYLISFPSKAMVVPDGEWERWSAIRTP